MRDSLNLIHFEAISKIPRRVLHDMLGGCIGRGEGIFERNLSDKLRFSGKWQK